MDKSGEIFTAHIETQGPSDEDATSQPHEDILNQKRTLPTDYQEFIHDLLANRSTIGDGADKDVFDHPTDPTKVVAVFKETNVNVNEVKRRFYVNKILHMLYPDNIPDISLASSKPMSLILEKAPGKQLQKALPSLKIKFHYLEAVDKLVKELSSLGVYIDSQYVNFHITREGNVQYIDDFNGSFHFSNDNLVQAIRKRLSPGDQEKALRYLTRLSTELNE